MDLSFIFDGRLFLFTFLAITFYLLILENK